MRGGQGGAWVGAVSGHRGGGPAAASGLAPRWHGVVDGVVSVVCEWQRLQSQNRKIAS